MKSISILIVAPSRMKNLEARIDHFLKDRCFIIPPVTENGKPQAHNFLDSYDHAILYTLGSDDCGSNKEVKDYAARRGYPLIAETLENSDAVYEKLLSADHGAIVGWLPEDDEGDEWHACMDEATRFANERKLPYRFSMA